MSHPYAQFCIQNADKSIRTDEAVVTVMRRNWGRTLTGKTMVSVTIRKKKKHTRRVNCVMSSCPKADAAAFENNQYAYAYSRMPTIGVPRKKQQCVSHAKHA